LRKKGVTDFHTVVQPGDRVGLFNRIIGDFLVYGEREGINQGINLRWLKDQTTIPDEDFDNWKIEGISFPNAFSLFNRSYEQYLKYEKRKWGINLGWQKTPPDNCSAYINDLDLILKTLVCHITEDIMGPDEIKLKINDEIIWKKSMNIGHTQHIDWQIPLSRDLGEIKISLVDADPDWWIFDVDPDDNLGERKIPLEPHKDVIAFKEHLAFYSLFYAIESHDGPANLELVSPSFGHPLICKPEQLYPFEATVATRSYNGDVIAAFGEKMFSIQLEDTLTGERYPCIAGISKSDIPGTTL
jgi:hypothetical protein